MAYAMEEIPCGGCQRMVPRGALLVESQGRKAPGNGYCWGCAELVWDLWSNRATHKYYADRGEKCIDPGRCRVCRGEMSPLPDDVRAEPAR